MTSLAKGASLECAGLAALWSSAAWRRDADSSKAMRGRARPRPTKAVPGHRTQGGAPLLEAPYFLLIQNSKVVP